MEMQQIIKFKTILMIFIFISLLMILYTFLNRYQVVCNNYAIVKIDKITGKSYYLKEKDDYWRKLNYREGIYSPHIYLPF